MESMGYPNFVFSRLTRPPEYLVLIDLPVEGDMYSYYADTLAGLLKSEGIHIEKYFYSRDPQVCYSWETGKRYELREFHGRFREHRLIIAGECEGLLDPVSGELVSWIELFKSWSERAIFTPKGPEKWGMKELRLSREFVVVPATVEGLDALTAHYEDPSIQRLTG